MNTKTQQPISNTGLVASEFTRRVELIGKKYATALRTAATNSTDSYPIHYPFLDGGVTLRFDAVSQTVQAFVHGRDAALLVSLELDIPLVTPKPNAGPELFKVLQQHATRQRRFALKAKKETRPQTFLL